MYNSNIGNGIADFGRSLKDKLAVDQMEIVQKKINVLHMVMVNER